LKKQTYCKIHYFQNLSTPHRDTVLNYNFPMGSCDSKPTFAEALEQGDFKLVTEYFEDQTKRGLSGLQMHEGIPLPLSFRIIQLLPTYSPENREACVRFFRTHERALELEKVALMFLEPLPILLGAETKLVPVARKTALEFAQALLQLQPTNENLHAIIGFLTEAKKRDDAIRAEAVEKFGLKWKPRGAKKEQNEE
jgi:hypothetical protein